MYFYLKDATTLKDAIENIKRACALGGVSVQGLPAQVETNVSPTVPFMIMNDRCERQPLMTVSFKEESSQDKVNESIFKLTQMMESQFQLAEKQDSDSRSRSRRKDRRNSRNRRPRSYDPVYMIDLRVERDQIAEIEVGIEMIEMIGVVETKVEIKVQETRETIQVQGIPQVCIVIIVK